MSRIFISYARENAVIADDITAALKELGLEPWIDKQEIVPGNSFLARMNEGLEDASYLLFLVSSASLNSRWVTREWMAALAQDSTVVIPLLLENVPLPALLRDIVYIDLRNQQQGLGELRSFFQRELSPGTARSPTDPLIRSGRELMFGALTLREIRLVANACMNSALLDGFLIDAEINPQEILGASSNERLTSLLHKVNRDGMAAAFAEWLALEQPRCFEYQLARVRAAPRWTVKQNSAL